MPKENNTERSTGGWRQRLHLLHGEAGEAIQGGSFSADVDIVASNVAKNVTAADLCHWLSQKGLFVKDCVLLTTSEQARSLAFKITIDPKDFDRATKDAGIWPYRVGVRMFKSFNRNNNGNRENIRNNGDEPERYNDSSSRQNGRDYRGNYRSGEHNGRGNRENDRSADHSRSDSRYDNYRRY